MFAAIALPAAMAVPAASAAPAAAPPAANAFPFPYNWSKFPAAWFAANATNWEDPAQIAAIGKYSMAILGWQHLDTPADWTAVVYTQLTQAAIIKAAHPTLPVFVYCGYGFAFGLNAGTLPVMESVRKDPQGSPYRDFFLQAAKGPVFTQTNCQQGHTSPGATGSRCLGYFWCVIDSSALLRSPRAADGPSAWLQEHGERLGARLLRGEPRAAAGDRADDRRHLLRRF